MSKQILLCKMQILLTFLLLSRILLICTSFCSWGSKGRVAHSIRG